jgi:ubiquinol-cytochrome c reductase iron-sulfur subunit
MPQTLDDPSGNAAAPPQGTRRNFLYIATAAFGSLGVACAAVPLFSQMEPDASTIAGGGPVDIDLRSAAPGQNIIVRWRSRPVYILRRPPGLLTGLQSPKVVNLLSDPDSKVWQQPPYAANWHRSIKPEILVVVGICTHLGCLPTCFPNASATTPVASWLGGYFCPCHGSKYDLAGRVYKGVPAPYNLPVPPYRFISDTIVRIGENPPGETFDFDSIVQL